MMQKLQLFFLFVGIHYCWSQTNSLRVQFLEHLPIKADQFWGNDGLGNYFYSDTNVLYKENNGVKIQYQNLPMGAIKKVDLTNPLRPVIFYENFNSAVVLDNYLNEIQTISFSNLPVPLLVNSIGMSNQNRLWIYDASLQQIGLFNLATNSFSPIGNPVQGEWQYYQCTFNLIQWIDSKKHWKTMSIYGQLTDLGEVAEGVIQLLDNQKALFMKGDQLFLKTLVDGKIYTIEIVEKSIKKIYCKEQILSIFTDKGITNYKITLP